VPALLTRNSATDKLYGLTPEEIKIIEGAVD